MNAAFTKVICCRSSFNAVGTSEASSTACSRSSSAVRDASARCNASSTLHDNVVRYRRSVSLPTNSIVPACSALAAAPSPPAATRTTMAVPVSARTRSVMPPGRLLSISAMSKVLDAMASCTCAADLATVTHQSGCWSSMAMTSACSSVRLSSASNTRRCARPIVIAERRGWSRRRPRR